MGHRGTKSAGLERYCGSTRQGAFGSVEDVPLLLGQTRTSSISEVCIKDVEDIVSEFCRLSEGEELLIYPTEFGPIEMTRETAFT